MEFLGVNNRWGGQACHGKRGCCFLGSNFLECYSLCGQLGKGNFLRHKSIGNNWAQTRINHTSLCSKAYKKKTIFFRGFWRSLLQLCHGGLAIVLGWIWELAQAYPFGRTTHGRHVEWEKPDGSSKTLQTLLSVPAVAASSTNLGCFCPESSGYWWVWPV